MLDRAGIQQGKTVLIHGAGGGVGLIRAESADRKYMATQTISNRSLPDFDDDSRYERIDGKMVERPRPVEKHFEVQFRIIQLLRQQIELLGGKALQEWSVAQPSSAQNSDPNYMTPDVVAVLPPITRTNKGYLIPPALLAVEISLPEQPGLITKARLL